MTGSISLLSPLRFVVAEAKIKYPHGFPHLPATLRQPAPESPYQPAGRDLLWLAAKIGFRCTGPARRQSETPLAVRFSDGYIYTASEAARDKKQ